MAARRRHASGCMSPASTSAPAVQACLDSQLAARQVMPMMSHAPKTVTMSPCRCRAQAAHSGLPLVVASFCLLSHRWASARRWQFLLEGLRDCQAELRAQGSELLVAVEGLNLLEGLDLVLLQQDEAGAEQQGEWSCAAQPTVLAGQMHHRFTAAPHERSSHAAGQWDGRVQAVLGAGQCHARCCHEAEAELLSATYRGAAGRGWLPGRSAAVAGLAGPVRPGRQVSAGGH
jgi:hypothetical protein